LTLKKSPERGSHPDHNDERECYGRLATHGIIFPVQQQQQHQQQQRIYNIFCNVLHLGRKTHALCGDDFC
jgi:hypothetical protein